MSKGKIFAMQYFRMWPGKTSSPIFLKGFYKTKKKPALLIFRTCRQGAIWVHIYPPHCLCLVLFLAGARMHRSKRVHSALVQMTVSSMGYREVGILQLHGLDVPWETPWIVWLRRPLETGLVESFDPKKHHFQVSHFCFDVSLERAQFMGVNKLANSFHWAF